MRIGYFDVVIIFGKEIKNDNQVSFKCPYNNQTNFNDLLEIISILFPEKKICPCSKYEIKGKENDYNSINKNDNIKEYINSIKTKEIILKIYKENEKCICELNYQKSKKENIDELLNSYKGRNNVINKIENLLKEIDKLQKDIKNLIEEIKTFLNECEKNNHSLNKENENNKIELEKVNNELSECKKDNDSLKKETKENKEKINKIEKENKELKAVSNKDFDYINEICENKKFNINEGENKITFENFYDIIIDIKSIKDIKDKWDIKMNEKGKEKYNIRVKGYYYKGKSFFLSKISKIELPSATSIRTEGLSIKHPEPEYNINRKIVLLDSVGLETPVLKDQEYDKFKNENKEKEYFKEKSREKLITDLFLQNYIINNSDILILLLRIFTYSEKKLTNKIIIGMIRNKNKDYLKKYLLNNAIFNLIEGYKISTTEKEIKRKYYYEKNNKPKIFHLIFVNDGFDRG